MNHSPGCRIAAKRRQAGAVALGKIFGAAHFLEAADGALEFEAAVARRVKARGLGIGGGEQLDAMLVERVDQRHEARGLVAHGAAHHRNADDDHGVEALGDGEIVGGAARLAAQPLEREYRDALEALGHVQRPPAADVEFLGRHLGAVLDRIVGQLEEGVAERRGRLRAVGDVPHLDAGQAVEPVVGRPVDRDHLHPLPDQVDERQEQLAVEPVLVEVARAGGWRW